MIIILATKPGECPRISAQHGCRNDCRNDADCSGEFKCCSTGCGLICVVPVTEPIYTTHAPYQPAYTEPSYISGGKNEKIFN